ncbi:hypothetical protein BN1183_AS_00060 [Pantoea ananatis]|nr:hypothetical protein BN1183_AS_00060 [Pantoea ananatis]
MSDQHRSLLKQHRAKHKYSVEGKFPQPAFRFCPIIGNKRDAVLSWHQEN